MTVSIPPMLEKLLFTILSSKKDKTERKSRLVNSIAQDLIYNATCGEKKTLKHIQLGIALKRKTGSRKIIQWLNRFGHSLSYKEVNVVETHLAEEQSNHECHKRYVPNNIQPSTMVTFVYDNCDHNVESLHGLTMHCTNGIVIQRSTPNVNALNIATATEVGSSGASMVRLPKRSSFKPAYHELLPYIKSKNKDIPSPILDVDENNNLLSELISNHHNNVWYLSRYLERVFPSSHISKPKHLLHYRLPTIHKRFPNEIRGCSRDSATMQDKS